MPDHMIKYAQKLGGKITGIDEHNIEIAKSLLEAAQKAGNKKIEKHMIKILEELNG